MKNLLIVNPVSGGKRGQKLSKILLDEIKAKNYPFDVEITKYKGHCLELTKKLAPNYDNVFAAGGDGTAFEMMNGLPKDKEIKVGIFPVGTGNDFFASMNLNSDIRFLLKYYSDNNKKVRDFDLFELKYKDKKGESSCIFVNVFGIGFDALVAHQMSVFRGLPGVTAYIASVFKALSQLKYINLKMQIDSNSVINGEKLLVTFGNSPRSGGGFYLTPYAKIDDKLVDIGIIDKIGKLKLIRSLPMALVNKIDRIPEISFYTTDQCEFSLENGYYAHADGEIISTSLYEGKISIVDHKLKMICG